MRLYKNSNGDSIRQITTDYSNVLTALEEAIKTLSKSDSLYHGRNALNNTHADLLRNQLNNNLRLLSDMKSQYEKDFEDISQPFSIFELHSI